MEQLHSRIGWPVDTRHRKRTRPQWQPPRSSSSSSAPPCRAIAVLLSACLAVVVGHLEKERKVSAVRDRVWTFISSFRPRNASLTEKIFSIRGVALALFYLFTGCPLQSEWSL